MIKCKSCGVDVQDHELFCGECGTKVEREPIPEIAGERVFCPTCGAENDHADMFCQGCGSKISIDMSSSEEDAQFCVSPNHEVETELSPEPDTKPTDVSGDTADQIVIFCPKCGAKNGTSDSFCQMCGESLLAGQQPSVTILPVKKDEKKSSLKWIIAGAAVLAVIGIAAIGMKGLLSGGSSKDMVYLNYYKDNEIYQYNSKNKKLIEMGDGAVKDKSRMNDFRNSARLLNYSKDNRYLFYMEDLGYSENIYVISGDLYFKDIKRQSDQKDTTGKIDSDITQYRITDDNRIIYLKSADAPALYIHDMSDKVKLSSDVSTFDINEDGSRVLWVTEEGVLYTQDLSKKDSEKEKLDSDVIIQTISKDLKSVFYMKEDVLYCMKDFSDKIKISSDVSLVYGVGETGHAYYLKEETPLKVSDFVTDDMAASDAAMQVPDRLAFQTPITNWSGSTYYQIDYDKYNAALDLYSEKEDRDFVRQDIKELTSYESVGSLYYFDGKESIKIADNISQMRTMDNKTDSLVAIQFNTEEQASYKLSEISSAYEIRDKISASFGESGSYSLVSGSTLSKLPIESGEVEGVYTFSLSAEGDTLFYIEDVQADGSGTLKSIDFSKGTLDAAQKVDSDVFEFIKSEGKQVYYTKDRNETDDNYIYYDQTIYLNGVKIDDEIYNYSFEGDEFYYFKDVSGKNSTGTLYRHNGKESAKIGDDAMMYKKLDGGMVAVLKDYNLSRQKGDLYIWKGKDKLDKVDEDVTFINGNGPLLYNYN